MKSKKIFFPCFQALNFLLILSSLSCGRSPNIPDYLNHDFIFGSTEGLYQTQDLKMLLSEQAVKTVTKDSHSNTKSLKEYENILNKKERMYKENTKANIFSLNELLKVTTAEKGEKVKISSSLNNIYIDPDIPFLNEYEILDYTVGPTKTRQQKILKELLGKVIDFKGFPNTDYYILPNFLGNYLILYKLASPDKIPYEELTLAKRIGNMLAVPLVGYSVEACQAIKVLGSNNIKETLKFRPVCKSLQSSQATEYIRLSAHKKQGFQYQKKLDFFQRDFFEGKWLNFHTLVRSPTVNDSADIIDPSFKTARLVKFQPSLGKLDVVEVNDLKQDDEKRVLFIPVEWRDYEIAKDSEKLDSNFFERFKDVDESQRAYLQIKFNELIKNEFEFLPEGGKSLKSAVITRNYISFDMEITTNGRPAYLMKYAFKRYVENRDYREKKWFRADSLLFFPLHSVKRKYYENLTDHTRADLNYFNRAVRFDPQSKEIVWHFSKQSSKLPWVRNLAYTAEKLLNKAFLQAGRDSDYQIKIRLDKSGEDKDLGDIRYNILNLIFSESEAPEQFTKGRNVANPFTGEVVATTANVWLTPILNEYISLIRKYIRFHIYPPTWKMHPFSKSAMDSIYKSIEVKNLQCADLSQEPLGVTPFFHEKINTVCQEVTQFIEDNKGQAFHLKNSALKDDEIVSSCAQKMAQEKILQSILKQLLNSFGLKNMLSSSFDSENFYNRSEIKALLEKDFSNLITDSHPIPLEYFSVMKVTLAHPSPPQYSSVMEVMHLQYPILSVPGKLDISALRFLYFDKLDLKNQKNCSEKPCVLEVPSGANNNPENPQKSILETALEQNYTEEKIKKHKICDLMRDPVTCGKEDYGSSQVEIAANKICELNNDFLIKRNRYDAAEEPKFKVPNKVFLINMYKKWKNYRNDVLAGQGKSIKDYSFLNPNHVKEYLEVIEKIKKVPEIKAYEMVRSLLFDYLKRLSFAPAKHCIYKVSGNSNYKAIALENIEEKILLEYPEISQKESEEFMNCQSPIVQQWAEDKWEKASELITEVGFFGKERRYLIRPNEKTDHVDELQAFNLFRSSFINSYNDIFEEPDLTAEYYRELFDYMNQGLDLKPYIDKNIITKSKIDGDIPLDRVLSYKIDTMEGMSDFVYMSKNLWHFRLIGLKKYRGLLQENLKQDIKTEGMNLFQQSFYYQDFSLTELRELANSIQKHPGLYTDFPFLTQIHEEYKAQRKEGEIFDSFIQKHPAVLYDSESGLYRFPYEDSEKNILSRLYRKYNKFLECIERHKQGNTCDQLEEKQAFIRLMLDTEDDFFQRIL